MTYKDQIKECETRLIDAMQENNIQVIENLLHEDLLFTIPTGQTVTKEMDLENLRSGVLKIKKITVSDQMINLIDDTAVVSVTKNINAMYGDDLIDANFRYLRVWKLFDKSWKVIAGSGVQI